MYAYVHVLHICMITPRGTYSLIRLGIRLRCRLLFCTHNDTRARGVACADMTSVTWRSAHAEEVSHPVRIKQYRSCVVVLFRKKWMRAAFEAWCIQVDFVCAWWCVIAMGFGWPVRSGARWVTLGKSFMEVADSSGDNKSFLQKRINVRCITGGHRQHKTRDHTSPAK